MKAITISTFRKRLKEHLEYVIKSAGVIVIPRGKGDDDDAVVVISISEYNSLKDTEHLMSTDANRKRLQESIDQAREGETIQYDPNKINVD